MKENLQNLQNNKEKQKKHFDCKAKESHYTEGDKIWLYTPVPNQDCPQNYHATGTDYTYEFEVVARLSDVQYKLKDPYHKWKNFTSHVNRIKSYVYLNDRPDDHDYDPDQTPKQGKTGEDQEMILDLMRQRHDSRRLEKFYLP